MLTKYYPLWCPETTKREPAQPEDFDFWLSSNRSPEFKVNVQQYEGHDYQRFYTEAYKKRHLKEPDAKVVRVRVKAPYLALKQDKRTATMSYNPWKA